MYVYGFGQIYEERKITNKEQHPTPSSLVGERKYAVENINYPCLKMVK
jgi:hypothetical protein